jgi:hypothetical protein
MAPKYGERVVTDKIEANEFGDISVRERTDVLRDGAVISQSFHRRMVAYEDDISNEKHPLVKAIAREVRKRPVTPRPPDRVGG